VLGMGLQGLEVTASSSKKVYPSPFVVLRLRNCLENCLVKCSAIHRGRVGLSVIALNMPACSG
jgi:hypothetical protein